MLYARTNDGDVLWKLIAMAKAAFNKKRALKRAKRVDN
jgi:hypothetical protein